MPRIGQRGSTLIFFAVVLLPIIFLFFTLGLDLSLYFTVAEKSQRAVDEAVMHGFKFLPNRTASDSAARQYLQDYQTRYNLPQQSLSISVDRDSISIVANSLSPLNFARWFGFDGGLPVQSAASARSIPLDVMLALDTSNYLAPQVINGTAWGNELDWPASDFLADEFPLYVSDPVNAGETIRLDPRLLTQQCFNPVFSAEKQAGALLYRYFASFRLHSVGIGFFPGQLFPLDAARDVIESGMRISQGEPIGEADFDYRSGSQFSSNLICAAVAQREFTHSGYRFPETPLIEPVIFDSTLQLNPDYLPAAKASEIIWSKSANAINSLQIGEVLREISLRLFSARWRQERGGLAPEAKKVAIMLLGDVPRSGAARFPDAVVESALRQEFTALRSEVSRYKSDLTLYFILFMHPALGDADDFAERTETLQQLLREFSEDPIDNGSLQMKALWGSDADTLARDIAASLVLEKRSVMLSR